MPERKCLIMGSSVLPLKSTKVNWREALHFTEEPLVFTHRNQLIHRWMALSKEDHAVFIIAEIGFGCGLNFLQTCALWAEYAPPNATLHFISSEAHPWTLIDLTKLWSSSNALTIHANDLLKAYPLLIPGVHLLEFNKGQIKLTLMFGEELTSYEALLVSGDVILEKKLKAYSVDTWFLNAFIPSNPLFSTMGLLSGETTTLLSSVKTEVVKSGLRKAGFNVEVSQNASQPLIANYQHLCVSPLKRHTPWHIMMPSTVKSKDVIVLGAGLAGCYTAYALNRRGWTVTLLDSESNISTGASGIQQAILYPKLSAFYSPFNDFMRAAYLYAISSYKPFIKESDMGELFGILQLAHDEKEVASQSKLSLWLTHYPTLGRFVNANEASILAGMVMHTGGIFLPQSGWMNIPKLCQFLVQRDDINCHLNTVIKAITYEGGQWHANEHHATNLVIANGHHASAFHQTKQLPLQAVRGQMSSFISDNNLKNLAIPLCADGHILPALDGYHSFGASYHLGNADIACQSKDDKANLEKLNTISKELGLSKTITGHWAGIRAATPDYLPLVGPVPVAKAFQQQFKNLVMDANRWIPNSGSYYNGLYIMAGFGSRGLTTIPLSAEWLARTLNKEPAGLSRSMVQSFSPARFLRREIIRGNGVAILKPPC